MCNMRCLIMDILGVLEDEGEHSCWIAQAPGASVPAAGGGNASSLNAADEDVLAEVSFDGGFRVPGRIYNRLFDYQKTGRMHRLPLMPMHDSLCHTEHVHDAMTFKQPSVAMCSHAHSIDSEPAGLTDFEIAELAKVAKC